MKCALSYRKTPYLNEKSFEEKESLHSFFAVFADQQLQLHSYTFEEFNPTKLTRTVGTYRMTILIGCT